MKQKWNSVGMLFLNQWSNHVSIVQWRQDVNFWLARVVCVLIQFSASLLSLFLSVSFWGVVLLRTSCTLTNSASHFLPRVPTSIVLVTLALSSCYKIIFLCHRGGDLALLWPTNQKVLHECYVEAVGRESVVLKITRNARDAWYVHVHVHIQKVLSNH